MKILQLISRIILGIVFTFSGFAKAVDPLGTAYKFTDYFVDAFGMPSLSGFALGLAIILNALEFLVGICLLINVKPRLASIGALLFMIIFTPLTLYIAIASPVEDCGCFGDAIKLSNWPTFYKNLILLPMAIFLFSKSKELYNNYKGKLDWIISGIGLALILFFQYYNLAHLPVIDFRPYSVGTYIPDKMVIPANEKPDSFAIFYTMEHAKTGESKEIDDSQYLKTEIWKDTLWKIVKTSEPVLVQKGSTPPIYNFKAYPVDFKISNTETPEDAMNLILTEENYSFLIISYDIEKANKERFMYIENLMNYAYSKNIKAHFLSSTTSGLQKFANELNCPASFYNTDAIALKTVIRSNPGLVLLKKGKIIGKWHYNDIPSVKKFDSIIK